MCGTPALNSHREESGDKCRAGGRTAHIGRLTHLAPPQLTDMAAHAARRLGNRPDAVRLR
jgi:hypothetical protein